MELDSDDVKNDPTEMRAARVNAKAREMCASMDLGRKKNNAAARLYTQSDFALLKEQLTQAGVWDRVFWAGLGFLGGAAVAIFVFSARYPKIPPPLYDPSSLQ
jgi:hypothetical protein